MKRNYFITAAVMIAVGLAAGLVLYPRLPERVPVHWNFAGVPDRYDPKLTAVLTMPGIMACLTLIFAALPWLSPRRFEVDGTGGRPVYLQIMLVALAFVAYVYLQTLAAGMGRTVNVTQGIMGAVCAMFAVMGLLMARLRRNFFVGVRTPWTLASEQVWQATHRFAAKTFLVGGLAGLVLAFLVRAPWAPFIALGAAGLAPVIHSLIYYKQLERRGEV